MNVINMKTNIKIKYFKKSFLQATQDKLNDALEILNNLVSNQEFRPWELNDNAPRLKYDIISLPPQVSGFS